MAKAILPEEELDIPSLVKSLAQQFGGWELLGKKLGRSRTFLKKLAEGKVRPTNEDIAKLKQLAGVSLTPVEKELTKIKPPGSGWEQIEKDFGDLIDQFADFKRKVVEALTELREEVRGALTDKLSEVEEALREYAEKREALEEIKREALLKLSRVDNRLEGYAEKCERTLEENEKIRKEIERDRKFFERVWDRLIKLKIYTLSGLAGLAISGIVHLAHGHGIGAFFLLVGIVGFVFVWRG